MAVGSTGRPSGHSGRTRHSASRRRRGRSRVTPEAQNVWLAVTLIAVAAVAALVSDAAPTGLEVIDVLWVAGFAALVAYFAGYARRWTWFLPAGIGGLLAADHLALACAAVAVGLGLFAVMTDRRSRVLAALSVGLGMAALLHTDNPVGIHGVTAALAAAATLPVVYSGYKLTGRTARRRIQQTATWSGAVAGLVLVGGALGVLTVLDDLAKGARQIDLGIEAARNTDDVEAQSRLAEASRYLHSAENTLTSWFVQPVHALPFVGPNVRAVSEMARETADATRVSSAAAATAELQHLRFEDGRLDPRRIERMVPALREVVRSTDTTRATADQVRSPWLVPPVETRLAELEDELGANRPDLERLLSAVEIASPLIGGEGDRRYLVLFTTPVEARGRTGFPGNYAELTFVDGKLEMPTFGRITELERVASQSMPTLSGPEEYLARYGQFEPEVTWRNITMSPDFPSIAEVAMELYPQSGGQEVDGVLTVDPTGLAALMHFTGPVDLPELEQPLTADNVEQFLHLEQYLTYDNSNEERIDFLEDVAEEVFDRLTQADLPSPADIIDVLAPAVEGNHIQLVTRFEDEADYFRTIELDGAMPYPLADAITVTTTNAAPNKIDAFLNRELHYDVTWDPSTGRIAATLTATLRNQAPPSGLPEYVIGNQQDLSWGHNVSYVSLYSPWQAHESRLNGEPFTLHPERELDRYAYSAFVEIPPGGEAVIELDLTADWDLPAYGLRLDPVPLVADEQASVTLTVAGEQPLTLGAYEDDWVLDGRTVRWAGPLVSPKEFVVSTPESADLMPDDMIITTDD